MKGNWNYSIREVLCLLLMITTFVNMYGQTSYIEVDAGDDHIICSGETVVIQACTADGYTYQWTSTDPSFNPTQASSISVSPTSTAAYTVTATPDADCINPNGGASCVNTSTVTIYVIEGISLITENNNSLIECMENRLITFISEVNGYLPNVIGDEISFSFNYSANDVIWTEEVITFNQEACSQIIMPEVISGDVDHNYPFYVFVEISIGGKTCSSELKSIDVYELWIDYFRDANDISKSWKVVVDDWINYGAISSSDCNNWEWGFTDFWFNTQGGMNKSGTDFKILPTNLPSNTNWGYFGETFGTISVSTTDFEGQEYYIESDQLDVSKKAEVFFKLLGTDNPGSVGPVSPTSSPCPPPLSGIPNITDPNWYYYWSYALGNFAENEFSDGFNCDGVASSTSTTKVCSATDYCTRIGKNAHWSTVGNPPTGNMFINGFWASHSHEKGHRLHRMHNISVHGSWDLTDSGADIDGDQICDREPTDPPGFHMGGWESMLGLDPNIIQTVSGNFPHTVADWFEVQAIYGHGNKDWAKPGSQW